MLAFVTGATGFVGSHVARVLAEQGADLRLLVRSSSDPKNIQSLKADRVLGDLRDSASLDRAIEGCDAVFHVAADYRLWVRDPEQMYLSNVDGTSSLLKAARKNRVRRVVYTSSVATMGLPSPKVRVPYAVALAAGVVDEVVTGRMFGREPRATIDAVRMGKKKMFVSCAKAEHELGWKVVPVDDAL